MDKSKKGMAFEKERAKYRQQIKELEELCKKKDLEYFQQHLAYQELKGELREKQEWIDRLLEYTEMTEEDMKRIIKKEKDSAEVMERVNDFFGVIDKHWPRGYF